MKILNDLIWNPEDNNLITTNGMTNGCNIEISCDGGESYLNSNQKACKYSYFSEQDTCNTPPGGGEGEYFWTNRCGANTASLSCN